MTVTKVTVGVYKYIFDAPIRTEEDTYTGYITCGENPESVYNLLHPGHNDGKTNQNVTLIGEKGTTVMTLERMKEYLNLV